MTNNKSECECDNLKNGSILSTDKNGKCVVCGKQYSKPPVGDSLRNTEGENPLLEKFNNPETIRKAASLRKQEDEPREASRQEMFENIKAMAFKPYTAEDFTSNVATKQEEKECDCPTADGYFKSECKNHCSVDTPHESEDWEAEFDKQFEEVILDQEVRTVIPGIKKFISEVESKAYQRGREEGEKKELEKYNELIFAVGNKYQGETRHETALRYIKQAEQGSGEEQAKSIISRLMKK